MDMYNYGHLVPRELKDKELLLNATHSIQDSFTSVFDFIPLHRIFIESSLELRNAIKQYEDGYIGSAFYSIRTAVELARVVAYFTTFDSPAHSNQYQNWTSGGRFPFDSVVKKKIEESSDIFLQVKKATGTFFEVQTDKLKSYQKYIHKQGYRPFYERGFSDESSSRARITKIETDFTEFLTSSIVEVALLRLCIDPLPLLLNDETVMRKVHFEMMTYPYSDELISLMGRFVDDYRSTDYYKDNVAFFADNEELSDEALTLVNESYYSREFKDILEPQLHLLSALDRIPVLLFNYSRKIAKVYSIGGFEQVFSDVQTPRKAFSWSSEMFHDTVGVNQAFDEVFLTYHKNENQEFWIEHIEPFTESEIKGLEQLSITYDNSTQQGHMGSNMLTSTDSIES